MLTDDPRPCANCGAPLDSRRKIFCDPLCREQAGFVRFVRKRGWDAIAADDELREQGYDNKLRFALGEGYGTYHVVDGETRSAVLERDGRRCVLCGSEEGLEVDHVGPVDDLESYNAAGNLRVLCQACHRAKTAAGLVVRPMTHQEAETFAMLKARIDATTPTRMADDPDRWDDYRKQPFLDLCQIYAEQGMEVEQICRIIDPLVAKRKARSDRGG